MDINTYLKEKFCNIISEIKDMKGEDLTSFDSYPMGEYVDEITDVIWDRIRNRNRKLEVNIKFTKNKTVDKNGSSFTFEINDTDAEKLVNFIPIELWEDCGVRFVSNWFDTGEVFHTCSTCKTETKIGDYYQDKISLDVTKSICNHVYYRYSNDWKTGVKCVQLKTLLMKSESFNRRKKVQEINFIIVENGTLTFNIIEKRF